MCTVGQVRRPSRLKVLDGARERRGTMGPHERSALGGVQGSPPIKPRRPSAAPDRAIDRVNFNFDPWFLLLTLALSSVGVVLLVYGKKQARIPYIVAGALLIVSPYVTTTILALVLVGAGVCGGLWAALRMGW
jgi:hypothetical protein